MKIWVQRVHGPVSGADSNRTELEVDEHVTVARLKVKYIESGSAGTHDYVSLYYDGAELDDRRPISDYGISEGDAVVHQSAVLHPYAPIDYTKLADAVDAEVGDRQVVMPACVFGGALIRKRGRSWGRGEEWQHFPPSESACDCCTRWLSVLLLFLLLLLLILMLSAAFCCPLLRLAAPRCAPLHAIRRCT